MAPQFTSSAFRFSRGARLGLAVLLFWALALPVVYLSRSPAAQALAPEDPFAPEESTSVAATTAPATTPAPVATMLEVVPLPADHERKIEAELEKPTTMDFQESPLQQVVDYLKDLHGIEIQLDDKALTDAGIDPETQVTKTLKGISLRSALRQLLGQYELTSIIHDEVLLITTTERASTELVTRVYPVGDLVQDDNYTDLTDALTKTVKPLTWEKGGGEGRWSTMTSLKSLVISQTQDVHDEILHLLRALRTVSRAPAVAGRSK